MAVRTREEMMQAVRARLGDDMSDDALSFIEDIQDTLNDYENKANGDGINWREKYEQNDKEWRTKYRERFFSGESVEDTDEPDEKPKKFTFNDLFKEE